ncbi:hypothetical protein ACN28S_36450 [Cystobacter fuscus]
MGNDGKVHITQLDASDRPVGTSFGLPANDFADLYADNTGGTLLLTRNARGGGTLNCGAPTNLCGTPPNPPVPCYDMYMVRFDGTTETWATVLTSSSETLPPYSTGPTGPSVYMIWWYAHHGRIAFDGTRYAGYFGAAISVSQNGCINIHQGDRMKVVGTDGKLQSGGFDWGCSHSGYERLIWDPTARKFVSICKTDNNNRIAFAPTYKTIQPVDLSYSNLGNMVTATGGGYWLTTSNIRSGQTPNANGLADVHLLHFVDGAPDKDIVLASDAGLNDRAPTWPPMARASSWRPGRPRRGRATGPERHQPQALRPGAGSRDRCRERLGAAGRCEGQPLPGLRGLPGRQRGLRRTGQQHDPDQDPPRPALRGVRRRGGVPSEWVGTPSKTLPKCTKKRP